jgi:hypothetical protein
MELGRFFVFLREKVAPLAQLQKVVRVNSGTPFISMLAICLLSICLISTLAQPSETVPETCDEFSTEDAYKSYPIDAATVNVIGSREFQDIEIRLAFLEAGHPIRWKSSDYKKTFNVQALHGEYQIYSSENVVFWYPENTWMPARYFKRVYKISADVNQLISNGVTSGWVLFALTNEQRPLRCVVTDMDSVKNRLECCDSPYVISTETIKANLEYLSFALPVDKLIGREYWTCNRTSVERRYHGKDFLF